MFVNKQRRAEPMKGNRFLITVTVLGSAGPIRFVVNENELVATVIDTALKSYAREGRLPILGSDLNDFILYCPVVGTEALRPWDTIGSAGVRNFMMCKKPQAVKATTDHGSPETSRKGSSGWKAWFHRSSNPKISSH